MLNTTVLSISCGQNSACLTYSYTTINFAMSSLIPKFLKLCCSNLVSFLLSFIVTDFIQLLDETA